MSLTLLFNQGNYTQIGTSSTVISNATVQKTVAFGLTDMLSSVNQTSTFLFSIPKTFLGTASQTISLAYMSTKSFISSGQTLTELAKFFGITRSSNISVITLKNNTTNRSIIVAVNQVASRIFSTINVLLGTTHPVASYIESSVHFVSPISNISAIAFKGPVHMIRAIPYVFDMVTQFATIGSNSIQTIAIPNMVAFVNKAIPKSYNSVISSSTSTVTHLIYPLVIQSSISVIGNIKRGTSQVLSGVASTVTSIFWRTVNRRPGLKRRVSTNIG